MIEVHNKIAICLPFSDSLFQNQYLLMSASKDCAESQFREGMFPTSPTGFTQQDSGTKSEN